MIWTGDYYLTWGSNSPVKYQFAVSSTGPWHDTMTTTDKYRRDSTDGGVTWGSPYQFRGTDGTDGSDANVTFDNIKAALQKANGIQKSFITANEAGFPIIYGGEIYGANFYGNTFNVYTESSDEKAGGFYLFGDVFGTPHDSAMYAVQYGTTYDAGFPGVAICSPSSARLMIGYNPETGLSGPTSFYGNVDFSNAKVTGITTTAVFA